MIVRGNDHFCQAIEQRVLRGGEELELAVSLDWGGGRLMMLRQRGRFRHHSGGNDMQDSAAFHNSLRPICSMMYADALAARAPMVRVGPYPPEVTNEAPSTTNRFLTSCAWLYLLRMLFFGSAPIRAVPMSWMAAPGLARSRPTRTLS